MAQLRGRRAGPSDPAAIFVTDVLNDYLDERGPKVAASDRIAYAVLCAHRLLRGQHGRRRDAADLRPYAEKRGRAPARSGASLACSGPRSTTLTNRAGSRGPSQSNCLNARSLAIDG